MTYTEFMARERKKVWIERLQIAAFAAIMTAGFFLFVAVLFQLDLLLGRGL